MQEQIRNVAIIAHVDHGKTTLVDRLLYQSGMFRNEELDRLAGGQHGLIFDSNPLERERGITILAKNCAIEVQRGEITYRINVIDTPGHADFGGEVERVLSMADGVLLLVDSFDGPMPQTRFVLQKALENGLKPMVIINKADRPDGRPSEVVDEVFDLLVSLEADDDTLDFPIFYCSGRDGWCEEELGGERYDLQRIFDAIIEHVPPPPVTLDAALQLRVSTLDHSEFIGRIAIGRIAAGKISVNEEIQVLSPNAEPRKARIKELHLFEGLGRKQVKSAEAGNICAIVGIENIEIGDTIACQKNPTALPAILVDEPTLHMTFRVNDGPFVGREGKYVTSRQLKDRLEKELERNVALKVEQGERPEEFMVSGRGLMHLGILLENMRREGFEMCVGMPRVIERQVEGKWHEPFEHLVLDCPVDAQGPVMMLIGERRAEMMDMSTRATGDMVHMEFKIPARGLIGLRTKLLTATAGRVIMHHSYLEHGPKAGSIPRRNSGSLIAVESGQATPYSLDALFDRGVFFVEPGDQVYEGQIVGEHNRDNDLEVNVVRTKKLTNIRAAGKDDNSSVRPLKKLKLEEALEFVVEGEMVEVTPESIRVRKNLLKEADRRREKRKAKGSKES
ncbi:MAG: translational GTPase TypA [Planctomycetia bacterium TMED53]|nr:MAG: translational GTPase TypA [Planctomycetia bacterium TMED53]